MTIDSKMIFFTCSSCIWSKADFFCLDSPSFQWQASKLKHLRESTIFRLIPLDLVLCSTQCSDQWPSRCPSILWSMPNLVGETSFQCEHSLGSLGSFGLAADLSSRFHVSDRILTRCALLRFLRISSAQTGKRDHQDHHAPCNAFHRYTPFSPARAEGCSNPCRLIVPSFLHQQ